MCTRRANAEGAFSHRAAQGGSAGRGLPQDHTRNAATNSSRPASGDHLVTIDITPCVGAIPRSTSAGKYATNASGNRNVKSPTTAFGRIDNG